MMKGHKGKSKKASYFAGVESWKTKKHQKDDNAREYPASFESLVHRSHRLFLLHFAHCTIFLA